MEGSDSAIRSIGHSKSHCSVLYYKAGPKKKKTYLDGILFIDKKSYSLFVVAIRISNT